MKKYLIFLLLSLFVSSSCVKQNDEYGQLMLKKLNIFPKLKMKLKADEPQITYPFIVDSKQNFLTDTIFGFNNSWTYMLAAYIPKGMSVKIVCTGSVGTDLQGGGNWIMQNEGWTITNNHPISFTYEASGDDKIVKVPFMCTVKKTIDFTIYENGATSPTRIRSITFQ